MERSRVFFLPHGGYYGAIRFAKADMTQYPSQNRNIENNRAELPLFMKPQGTSPFLKWSGTKNVRYIVKAARLVFTAT